MESRLNLLFQHYMLQATRIQNHVFSHDKENLKHKMEQEKEHDSQPNISFHRSVMTTVEQQPPQSRKAFKENSSITDLPDFTWAKKKSACKNVFLLTA